MTSEVTPVRVRDFFPGAQGADVDDAVTFLRKCGFLELAVVIADEASLAAGLIHEALDALDCVDRRPIEGHDPLPRMNGREHSSKGMGSTNQEAVEESRFT